ncbi:Multidrug resistance protein [Exophiala xenobiotica]|nr:Multidrug resistance protein [Exophiala xenobiotica]
MALAGYVVSNYDRTLNAEGPGTPSRLARRRELDDDTALPGNQVVDEDSSRVTFSSQGTDRDTSTLEDETVNSLQTASQRRGRQIRNLARQYTHESAHLQTEQSLFNPDKESNLDPSSDNFDPTAWTRTMFELRSSQQQKWWMGRSAGFCFRNLSAYGFGTETDYQPSVGNMTLRLLSFLRDNITGRQRQRRIDILQGHDGLVQPGELLVVLGPPGSGCTTFLKTLAGDTHGYHTGKDFHMNYQGISWHQMHKNFRGEAIYTAEQDVHFPQLTVGDTLYFAAQARAPRVLPTGITKERYAERLRDVVMATFGIRHTIDTKVGNEYVRGVSGGERKRVTIAEAALSGAPLQCWDNSTRGLDSANAIEFCKTLRLGAAIANITAAVSIYQAPQAAFEVFDKALVLYDGRQIYFGPTRAAQQYFMDLGFERPARQTDADFITSMTNPRERIVRNGFENRVPRTAAEFAGAWKKSPEYGKLLKDIELFENAHPLNSEDLEKFKESRSLQQARRQHVSSPYTLSYLDQVQLCLWRAYRRLVTDPTITLTALSGNFTLSLVIGSVFNNLREDTSSFFSRGTLLFFAILMSAFSSALEILTLYAQRPIVEKHARYALYHPSAEAFASMLMDMPYKIVNAHDVPDNCIGVPYSSASSYARIYYYSCYCHLYGILDSDELYAGVARWINYLDPIAYGFEALMINEFSGRKFPCVTVIPPYGSLTYGVCSAIGAVAGQDFVSGERYIESAYQYKESHRWRNFGIIWAFMIFLCATYLVAAEYGQEKKPKGEVLVFRRGKMPKEMVKPKLSEGIEGSDGAARDTEAAITGTTVNYLNESELLNDAAIIQRQTTIFHWNDVCYDIRIKGGGRRILDHVDGWVKPGTLTAMVGVSGAGKTTLLDVLATRVTNSTGVVTGEILVDGTPRDDSFQRKIAYVQQQDLHLATSTVREALTFSALLHQPAHIPRTEKVAYVEKVIKLLDMQLYADAVIGVLGEGLNVEQRKRLTIGVELAAKPQLLFFLDEPTSGLDSQTSWSILSLLEKLRNNGQAILCTIHQPSAMLFQRFDRLLLLADRGRTSYFGPIGESCKTVISYFEKNGAPPCPPGANPAEWLLNITGGARDPSYRCDIDWPRVWKSSLEFQAVRAELDDLEAKRPRLVQHPSAEKFDKDSYRSYAAPFWIQYHEVQKRVFEQYWRTPSYIYSKLLICAATALFIGFSFFNAKNTQQGLQNQMFGLFMLLTIFGQLVQQTMPLFVTQRSLYEVRERPAKTYSWKVFMLANIVAEIPWNFVGAILLFFCWYYPIGLYRNAQPTDTVEERGALMWLLILAFLMFTSTFAHMIIANIETAETGGHVANLMFSLCLTFCGVLATPKALPGFWIFMYRVSPFTYLVAAMLSTAVMDAEVRCAENEYLRFKPPPSQTCEQYMEPYINVAGGYLLTGTPGSAGGNQSCAYCQVGQTNAYLASLYINPHNRWRNLGLLWVYIIFNVFGALFLYWLGRVPKKNNVIGRFWRARRI